MKVVCANLGENLIYDTYIEDITIGKIYDVISQDQDFVINDSFITDYVTLYNLRNDKGDIIKYNKKLFINLDEWREIQLSKIL